MATAYSYIRFSTLEQSKGDSHRRQLELSERYCEQNGLALDTSLNLLDLGVSAFRGHNAASGQLGLFLQAAETGRVKPGSYLLIESLDRLSRSEILTALNLFTRILDHGVVIVTLVDQKVYTRESVNNLPDLMYSLLIMSRAHEESLTKSKRVAAAWDNKRKTAQAKVLTQRIPAWLRVRDGRIEPIPERVELVQRIFTMSLNGAGHLYIAKTFNQEGIKPWGDGIHQSRQAKGWYASYIAKILSNRAVTGEYTPHKLINKKRVACEPVAGYYPEVIDEATFHRVRHAHYERKKTGGPVGEHANLLSGLLSCGVCAGMVIRVARGRKETPTYMCQNSRLGIGHCERLRWSSTDLEQAILQELHELDIDEMVANCDDYDLIGKLRQRLQAIDAAINQVNTRIERLVQAIEEGQGAALATRIVALEKERDNLLADRGELVMQYEEADELRRNLELAKQGLAALNLDSQTDRLKARAAIRRVVGRIIVFLTKRTIIITYRVPRLLMFHSMNTRKSI